MARDVEFNLTANDKTGTALTSAEAKFKASQERIRREGKKTGDSLGDSVKKGVDKSSLDIADKLQSTFGLAGVSGGELLAIGVAAAAPVIGALISAAVIGGASAGGVVGGVILASRDPRVKAAGTELGQTLLSELTKDAAPFIEPVLRSIDKIEIRFKQMNGTIKNIFSNSSGFLDPLVDGALDGVQSILKGVDSLVAKGKPVIDAFGKSFRTIGDATGKALTIISGDSKDAADALNNLAQVTATVIKGAGYLVRGLTELYGFITFLPRHVRDYEKSLFHMDDGQKVASESASVLAAVQKTAGTLILSAGEAAGKAGLQMATYADQMDDASSKGRGLYDSQTAVGEAMAAVREAAKKNGDSLSANTKKGRENRTALSNLAAALQSNYDAYVKVNGEGAAAQKVAANNRASFVKLATQFGLTGKQAANLATDMGLIPANKNTDFHANTHDAEARLKALQDRINATHGKTVNVNVSVTGTERLNALGHRIGGYSAGDMSWAATDRTAGISRTGGPDPMMVSVDNSLAISLDGRPFRSYTAKQIRDANERAAWRQKVGRR